MNDEEIKQTIEKVMFARKAREGVTYTFTEFPVLIEALHNENTDLINVVDSLSNKLTEREKEIERLKAIEKAADEVCYYQGTEGSADKLERLLGYPEDSKEQGK